MHLRNSCPREIHPNIGTTLSYHSVSISVLPGYLGLSDPTNYGGLTPLCEPRRKFAHKARGTTSAFARKRSEAGDTFKMRSPRTHAISGGGGVPREKERERYARPLTLRLHLTPWACDQQHFSGATDRRESPPLAPLSRPAGLAVPLPPVNPLLPSPSCEIASR